MKTKSMVSSFICFNPVKASVLNSTNMFLR